MRLDTLQSAVAVLRQRKRWLAAVGVVLGLWLCFSSWVERELAWLKAQEDPYGLEVLSREPDGVEETLRAADGTQLRAVSKGSGRPVLLVHGLSASLHQWNVLWPLLLEAGYRVIAFDLRGHGKSTVGSDGMTSAAMARDLGVVLDHYAVEEGVLVGHSLGGYVSTVFLVDHAKLASTRLRGAVLVSTFAGTILQGSPGWNAGPAAPDGTWKERVGYAITWALVRSGMMARLTGSDAGHVLSRGMMGSKPTYSVIHTAATMMARHDFDQALPIMKASYYEDYYPRLKTIQLPVVAIVGDADTATRPWHAERIAREIPAGRAVLVPGSGHLINWEAPGALVDAVRSLDTSGVAKGSAPGPETRAVNGERKE